MWEPKNRDIKKLALKMLIQGFGPGYIWSLTLCYFWAFSFSNEENFACFLLPCRVIRRSHNFLRFSGFRQS